VSGSQRRVLAVLTVLAAGLGAGACTAGVYDQTPLPPLSSPAAPSPSARPSPSGSPTPSPSPSPSPSSTDIVSTNCLQSYAPTGSMPTPGQMPRGSTMRRIQDRGYLIAGVSADSLLLGARNPVSNEIEGFDIDMLHAVSQALFGRPDKVVLKVITSGERLTALQKGTVDVVARNMTITCKRWEDIAFSSEYYRSGQKVLVRKGEAVQSGGPIGGIEDLAGRKVCAPDPSTSITKLRTFKDVEAVGAATHTGCLVLFQRGAVDAITGDDTVLAGLADQDPFAEVVQAPAFTAEPYGLGVNRKQVDFVRFVNGVLEDMKADGRWTKSYNRWLAESLGKAPAPPEPVYGRAP
jgi:polar amino acid transport system substrate-binding protein